MLKNFLAHRINYKLHYIFYGIVQFLILLIVAWFVRPEIILLWNILYSFSIIHVEFYARDTLDFHIDYPGLYVTGIINLVFSNLISILSYKWIITSSIFYFDIQYRYTELIFIILSIILSIVFFFDGVLIFKYNKVDRGFYIWSTVNSLVCFMCFIFLGNPIVVK